MLWIPMVLLMEAGFLFNRRYEKTEKTLLGQWLSEETTCKFCGNPINQSAVFCPKCERSQK